ncbi:glycosyltransferase family 2 protein [Magnetovibrio sp.]|uniref:glycosyltransferase family 2 protein n=1 Tax=Magnetovibrio sp. TaxID=2024836 RepID=UPI002F949A8B
MRIVIVNYNSGPWLQKVIDGLALQTFEDFEVVIVDNDSSDDSFASLSLPDARFHLVALPNNTGFAFANNRGFEGSSSEWFCTLNPDCIPESDWLTRMSEASRRFPDIDMFGSTQLMADMPDQVDGYGDFLSIYGIPWRALHGHHVSELPDDDIFAFSPCAAAAFYRRTAYEKVGGFEEAFFCYLEDIDLGWRLQRQGAQCVQVRRAVVHHKGSLITIRNSPFSLYHSQRNRVWMVRRNMPPLLAGLSLLMGALLYIPILLFKYDGAGRKAALRGALDGVRTPTPVAGVERASLWGDMWALLRNRLITINPYVLSRKMVPLVRKAGK